MHDVKKITLRNGLRALFIPNPRSMTTTVGILVGVGSDYEMKRENGISHFLEHMCFKGTKNRPTPLSISSELDAMGASYNAFTSNEYTSYYAKVEPTMTTKAFDVVSDIYLNSIFPKAELDRERGVIVEEMNMYEDQPQRKVYDLLAKSLYGNQPAGRTILGTKENIRRFTPADFQDYRKRYYTAPKTVLFFSGNFRPAEAERLARARFGEVSRARVLGRGKTKERQARPSSLVHFKKSDQTHFLLGFRAFSYFDERRYALYLLSNILGGGMSSRLWNRIREQMGAAYYVYGGEDLYADRGYLVIGAGVNHGKVREAISGALSECKKICETPVGKEELTKAKNHMIGHLSLGLETSNQIGYFYAEDEILRGKMASPEAFVKRIKAVTPREIQAVARTVVRGKGLNLALIGPFKKEALGGIVRL